MIVKIYFLDMKKLTLKDNTSRAEVPADTTTNESFISYVDHNENPVSVQDKKKELLAALEDNGKPK